MPTDCARTVLVTGGSGFIGSHLLPHLSTALEGQTVVNLDLQDSRYPSSVLGDIGAPPTEMPIDIDTVVHLAAVSREPGFKAAEYYKTNVEGTKRLLEWAADRGVRRFINFSSISVFGATETPVDESAPHYPETPYGMSKSLSEALTKQWAAEDPNRSATSIRPGIVFGPGDPGNFGRMLTAVRKGWFILPGRRDTRKAGIYVKDLVRLVAYLVNVSSLPPALNAVYPDTPPVLELVKTVQAAVAPDRDRGPVVLPAPVMRAAMAAMAVTEIRKPEHQRTFHTRRVDKLVTSTNVVSRVVGDMGFTYRWTWQSALEDWALSSNTG